MSKSNENFSNEIPAIPEPEIVVEGEGADQDEESLDIPPSEEQLVLEKTIDTYADASEGIATEANKVANELATSGLPPEQIVEEMKALEEKTLASYLSNAWAAFTRTISHIAAPAGLAVLGSVAAAQTAEAGGLHDIFNSQNIQQMETVSRRHNTTDVQVEQLRGRLIQTEFKRQAAAEKIKLLTGAYPNGYIANVEQNEQDPNAHPNTHTITDVEQNRMDAEYQKQIADLQVKRLEQEEALSKDLTPEMRAAKMNQIKATYFAGVAQLAEQANTIREKELGYDTGGADTLPVGEDTTGNIEDLDTAAKLNVAYARLDSQERQIILKIRGLQTRANFQDMKTSARMYERHKQDKARAKAKKKREKEREARKH